MENGIDIPNANTIIINQAQKFGLSDLHQLRGRVGRSNVKAYCYLVVPPIASLTEDARRRIRAIEAFFGSVTTGSSRCGMPLYCANSTIFGSIIIILTSVGFA